MVHRIALQHASMCLQSRLFLQMFQQAMVPKNSSWPTFLRTSEAAPRKGTVLSAALPTVASSGPADVWDS